MKFKGSKWPDTNILLAIASGLLTNYALSWASGHGHSIISSPDDRKDVSFLIAGLVAHLWDWATGDNVTTEPPVMPPAQNDNKGFGNPRRW